MGGVIDGWEVLKDGWEGLIDRGIQYFLTHQVDLLNACTFLSPSDLIEVYHCWQWSDCFGQAHQHFISKCFMELSYGKMFDGINKKGVLLGMRIIEQNLKNYR